MSPRAPFTPGDANDIFLNQLGKGRRTREVFIWKRSVYKSLVDAYGLPRSLLNSFSDEEKDPEKAFRAAVEDQGEIEWIVAHKAEVTLGQLLDKPLDNPAFKALCDYDLRDPFSDGGGVVFPLYNHGDWIIHTLGHPLGTLGGRSYIIIYANTNTDRDIIAESLKQFIATRKAGGL